MALVYGVNLLSKGVCMWGWLAKTMLMGSMLFSALSWAQDGTKMSWLDNRFRVDSTVSQVTFIIHREEASQPVVLVRPDGVKYYAWKHPENVAWLDESSVDVISIEAPMPGPWQAIGKVTPDNKIKVLSNLTMSIDKLPAKIYATESIKFTARLAQNGKPILLKNFLEKVNLTVTMTRFVPNEDEIPESQKPMPIILGSFADDGSELDERAGDGIFTVALPIAVLPGKYHVRIQSNNDVFLRAIEQDVLVYPTPIQVRFAQSRDKEKPHKLFVDTENGIFEEGSLIAHIEQVDPKGKITINQGQSEKGTNKLQLILPNSHALGRNSWQGRLYVTEKETQREIVFPLKQQNYSVVDLTDFTNTQKEYQARLKAEREAAEVRRLEQQRQDARFQTYLYIAIGNLVIILLVVSGIFGWRKLKSRKVEKEASLSLP